jgi:hypothetical protein
VRLSLYLNAEKSWGGCLDLTFGFSGVNETDFGEFRSDYLGEYDAICKRGLAWIQIPNPDSDPDPMRIRIHNPALKDQ